MGKRLSSKPADMDFGLDEKGSTHARPLLWSLLMKLAKTGLRVDGRQAAGRRATGEGDLCGRNGQSCRDRGVVEQAQVAAAWRLSSGLAQRCPGCWRIRNALC